MKFMMGVIYGLFTISLLMVISLPILMSMDLISPAVGIPCIFINLMTMGLNLSIILRR